MLFLPKVITICFREENRFDCKNNHMYGKSASFRLDNLGKIKYRRQLVLLYFHGGSGLIKSNWSRKSLICLPHQYTVGS